MRALSSLFGVFFLTLALSAAYLAALPDVRPLRRGNPKTTAYIELDRERARQRGWRFQPRWTWVPWDRISDHLKHAVVTAEDDAFYRHRGVDWDSMQMALSRDIELKRFAYGGSTITQQVARNLYLSPSKNPLRKLKEMLIAWRLERELGKRRILEIYLNIAQWGKGVYGCEAAAQVYFRKSAADLTPEEAVALAVILPSPARHDPAKGGPYVERNMRRIIERMRRSGYWPEIEPADLPFGAALSTAASGGLILSPAAGPPANEEPPTVVQ